MKKLLLAFCCFAPIFLGGCGDSTRPTGPGSEAPDYRVVELQNTSAGKQKRFTLKIVLPSHYPESSVRSTLVTISNTVNEPESEITMLFYGPDSDIHGPYDVARVVWDHGISELEYRPPAAGK